MDNDIIVGLGGHIDHGKTSLIKALNGFDGDENLQEKERGITLDISFSDLKTPQRNIAFIDVPGHQKLVKNMIAGAFGIDILLLVVACDDGIMPQTIEHLEIANFLGVQKAICVFTKADLLQDETRILELEQQVEELFGRFSFISLEATILFSMQDKKLQNNLLILLSNISKPSKNRVDFFRYYVDRSFSLKGIGSVVSGSVVSGSVAIEQKIFVCELQQELQVRSLQVHHKNVVQASFSHRVAINLANINSSNLKRGYLLTQKGFMRGFHNIDTVLYTLCEEEIHNKQLQFYIGAKKCNVRVIVLQKYQDKIFATLCCEDKIFSIFKERFILRDDTKNIAGGMVLNPIADPIKKTQKISLLKSLLKEDFLESFEIVTSIHKKGFGLVSATQRFGLNHQKAVEIASQVKDALLDIKNLVLYHQESLIFIETEILRIFMKNPLALLSAKSLVLRIPWASVFVLDFVLNRLLQENKIVKNNGLFIAKENKIKDLQNYISDQLFTMLLKDGKTPQAPYNLYEQLDIDRNIGDRALKKLCTQKKVIRLQHNLFIPSNTLQKILSQMRLMIQKYGYVDLEILKQEWRISRKYLIAYLDHLDYFEDINNIGGKRYIMTDI